MTEILIIWRQDNYVRLDWLLERTEIGRRLNLEISNATKEEYNKPGSPKDRHAVLKYGDQLSLPIPT